MVSPVNLSSAVPSDTGTATGGSPTLDAQLQNYRAQLEQYGTSASANTPEGKARIRDIVTRLDAIKGQIDRASSATAKEEAKRGTASRPVDQVPRTDAAKTASAAARLHWHVDTYV